MVQQVQSQPLALLKALLHAAKYPSATVNGVLLGSVNGDAPVISDAVPLFHTTTALAAPVEVALTQVEVYAQQSGQKVIGYYHSDSRFQAGDLPAVGRKIADKISDHESSAVVLVLDNRKFGAFVSGDDVQPFELFTKDGSRGWKRDAASLLTLASGSTWKTVHQDFSSLIQQHKERLLHDFDEHLDDISKDWLNPELAQLGKFVLPGQQH